jgi:hypothetical protein
MQAGGTQRDRVVPGSMLRRASASPFSITFVHGTRRHLKGPISRPGESAGASQPPPLSGPDVTVSRHPALTVRPQVNATSCQWANRPGLYWYTFCSHSIALAYLPRNRLNFCMAHRTRCSLMRHARKNNSER